MKAAIRVGLVLLVAFGGILGVTSSFAAPYFNSSEPGCDGSDPNVLWCDDFERGSWFVTTANVDDPQNAGWNGTPFGGPDPQGKNFGRCGGQGAAGTNCAAGSGPHSGQGQAAGMADHDFNNKVSVDEVYMRYYRKALPGYTWGLQKMWSVNPCCAGIGGIKFGNNFVWGGSTVEMLVTVYAENANRTQNVSSISFQPGRWYYIEEHIKLNTPGSRNGVLEIWIDDCGTNGLGCTGSGTLRARHTDVLWRAAGDNTQIGSIWLENWANPASVGEEYYDQVKISRVRVGPMGAAASSGNTIPPAAPTSPAIR